MFDIGWSELMLIGLVALLVIGPKDLPKAIYGVGKWVRKARLVAREFQTHVDDMMREAEIDDLRNQALKARDLHMGGMGRMVEDVVDPKGELKSALDLPPAPSISAPETPVEEVSAPASAALPPAPAPAPVEAPPPTTPEKSA